MVTEKITDTVLDIFKGGIENFADLLLSPNMNANILKRRLKNARSGLADIEVELQKMGLTVDYARYFEQHLKIPVLVVESLSDEEEPSLRELLKKLFTKHLSGEYEDDSFYPAFISIIKELAPMDVALLKSTYEQVKKCADLDVGVLHGYIFELAVSEIAPHFKVSDLTLKASIENLERCSLITTIHSSKITSIEGAPPATIGEPLLTHFGDLFCKACIE